MIGGSEMLTWRAWPAEGAVGMLGAARRQHAALPRPTAELLERTGAELTADIFVALTEEIASLRTDDLLLAVLDASISENVATLLHIFEHGIAVDDVEAPAAALEYARRLAQRGVSLTDLIRAYRLGQACFLERVLPRLSVPGCDAEAVGAMCIEVVALTSAYIDKVTESVCLAYEQERDRWQHHRSALRAAQVHQLVSGAPVDVDAAQALLGYRLRQGHVGVVAWGSARQAAGDLLDPLLGATSALSRVLGIREEPLFVACDARSAFAWIPLGSADRAASPLGRLAGMACPAAGEGISLAVGECGRGLEGFARTHHQACAAQAVALAGGDEGTITRFGEVGPLALMCADLAATRAWVGDTLGPLARVDPASARMRATLAAFFEAGGSYTEAAARLGVHKNTVQYRVRRAAEVRGRPWRDDRLHVELALHACARLGPAVLSAPAGEVS